MGIDIIQGRNYDVVNYGYSDTLNYLINEKAAALMGFENPIGKQMSVWGDKGKIIGVVQDYHFSNLEAPVAPLILRGSLNDVNWMLINFSNTSLTNLTDKVNDIVLSIEPEHSLTYELLEDSYRDLFSNDITLGRFALFFVFVSVIISIIGLYGLSSYQTERQSKEVSIRKVFGASPHRILIRLWREYLLLFVLASIMAIPVAIYFADDWLSQYVYRIHVSISYVIYTMMLLLMIGLAAISYKTIKTSKLNPAQTLKME
jgi:hypothetical protein